MDVITAVKLYVNKMTNESGPGMKILLMDKETVSFNKSMESTGCLRVHLWRCRPSIIDFCSWMFDIIHFLLIQRPASFRWHSANRTCSRRRCICLKDLIQLDPMNEWNIWNALYSYGRRKTTLPVSATSYGILDSVHITYVSACIACPPFHGHVELD